VKATKAPAVTAKTEKAKKVKLVRDSLSIPKDEYEVISVLKVRAGKLGHAAKKTEIIRAGIKAIAALSDQALLKALQSVPSIKTGRPAKHKSK
jgi:preprotein translocase subunit SecB